MSRLELAGVDVTYPGPRGSRVKAVSGASLTVEPGRILALVGESGCGKSSLGKAAVGLIEPSEGLVRFAGKPVRPISKGPPPLSQRRLQMIFQDPYSSLNPRRRVGEQIADGFRATGHRRVDSADVARLLDRVGLAASAAERFPHEFSGGQRQRIAIARALAARPDCIIADEPISALDASAQAAIANLLVDLVRTTDMGLLFISHDLSIVRRIADEIAVMYLGRIVETGTGDALWSKPLHPYTEGLVGAIPKPDGAGTLPRDLPGDVPDPAQPPSGCRFHPRCPLAFDRCRVEDPQLRDFSGQRRAACHLADNRARDPRAEHVLVSAG